MDNKRLSNYIQKEKQKKRWIAVVTVLGVIASLATNAMLTNPADAMTGTLTCEKEEHTHTGECFQAFPASVNCPENAQEQHLHSENCYDAEGNLICDKDEFVIIHTHDAECYDKDGNLICNLPEVEEHEHTEECYDAEGNLICEKREIKEHPEHTEECYTVNAETGEKELTCTYPFAVKHQHTGACHDQVELAQICTKEEHVHTEDCYEQVEEPEEPEETEEFIEGAAETVEVDAADDTAEVAEETAEEPVMEEVTEEVTEETVDVVKEATEEVTEPAAEEVTEDTADPEATEVTDQAEEPEVTIEEVTEPAEEVPEETVIAMPAVSFEDTDTDIEVYVTAEADTFPEGTKMVVTPISAEDVLGSVEEAVTNKDMKVTEIQAVDISFYYNDEEIQPAKPINVVMKPKNAIQAETTSVVHIPDEGEATVVQEAEGVQEEVQFDTPEFSVYALVGQTVVITSGTFTVGDETYEITVTYDESAGIPQGAELRVSEIIPEQDKYQNYYQEALVKADIKADFSKRVYARLFDIEIWANDKKIEPTGDVIVDIHLLDTAEKQLEQLDVIHFAAVGVEKVETAEVGEDTSKTVEFATDEFSVYAIVGTETLTTKVITAEGETYTIEVTYGLDAGIPEGAVLSASEVLPGDDGYESYVEDSASVIYCNVEDLSHIRIFDISILSSEGEKIEPLETVQVKITYDTPADVEDTQEVKMIHFDESEPEVIDAETDLDENGVLDEVCFSAESFSAYAVVAASTTNLNGRTLAIINNYTHDSVQDTALSNTALNKIRVTVNNDGRVAATGNATDEISTWTFTSAPNGGNWYYIRNAAGQYIHLTNNAVTLSNTSQAIYVHPGTGNRAGMVRIRIGNNNNNNGNYALNDYGGGNLDQGIGSWNDSGDNEWFRLYELGDIETTRPYITVHYVDQSGNKIAEDKNLADTTKVDGTANYTDPYVFGDIYDMYQAIPGYAYQSAHLNSTTGTQINAEVVYKYADSWNTANDGDAYPSSRVDAADYRWEYQNPNGTNASNYNLVAFNDSAQNPVDVYLVYTVGEETIPSHGGGGSEGDEHLDEPKPVKTVLPNGDGTYTMSLSVNASTKEVSKTTGANILMIFDMSYSMDHNPVSGYDHRLAAAKAAAKNMATGLLALNEDPENPLVEMMVLPFNAGVLPSSAWLTQAGNNNSTNNNRINGFINNLSGTTGGTNWEAALEAALAAANAKTAAEIADKGYADDTYVLFLTDGNPWYGQENAHDTYIRDFFEKGSYIYATEPARQIVKAGYEMYGVGMYGNTDVLHLLMNFAYTGRSTYDPTGNTYGHFFLAQNQDEMLDALSNIAGTIEGKLSMAGAEFKDGIAADTTHTSMATSGGSVSGITYSKNNGTSANFTVKLINGTPMFSINGGTEQAGTIETVTFDKLTGDGSTTTSATATVYQLVVGTGSNAVTYQMPAVSVVHDNETNVDDLDWDLSPLGILENGATYTISTVIWPDQDVYDLVADLNNGTASVEWNDSIARNVTTADGTTYRAGGIAALPNVIKIGNTYAALSNTYQTFDYYVADTEEGDTTYTKPDQITLPFPKPMDLTSTLSKIEKKWNVELQRTQLVRYLYNTDTGDSKTISLPFQVIQDKGTAEEKAYKTIYLGWSTTTNDYVWEDEKVDVTVDGRTYQVGSIWADDFALATGIMLSETRMDALGLDKSAYPSGDFGGTTYYILESGHDYDIVEPPIGSYRFDFETQTYHPMLVDGTLKSVNFTINGDTVSFTYMTPEEGALTSLRGENTLRGGINLNKKVVDQDNKEIDPDTKFEFTITLNNTKEGLFTGDNTPWYAVNNLYYHDTDGNYISEADAITLYGDKATADAQGGNVLTATSDGKMASATLKITSTDSLRIANVPAGTTYTIVESDSVGYELISIDKKIEIEGSAPETITDGIDVVSKTVTGEIVPNRENNLTFTNKRTGIQVRLLKVDAANEETKLDGVTFDLYSDAEHTKKVNTESIITANGGLADLGLLAPGTYYLVETNAKDGYNKLANDIQIMVSGTSVTYTQAEYDGGKPQTAVYEDNVYTITVRNSTGYELPHTGGPGTLLYTLSGLALILASALMYVFRMRREERRLN